MIEQQLLVTRKSKRPQKNRHKFNTRTEFASSTTFLWRGFKINNGASRYRKLFANCFNSICNFSLLQRKQFISYI